MFVYHAFIPLRMGFGDAKGEFTQTGGNDQIMGFEYLIAGSFKDGD